MIFLVDFFRKRKSRNTSSPPPDLKIYQEKIKSLENRISDLNLRIDEKQDRLEELENRKNELDQDIENLKQKHWGLAISYDAIDNSAKQEQEKKIALLEEQKALNEAILASKTALQSISGDIEKLEREKEDLKEKKRLALLNQDEVQENHWEFSITDNEKELISILERIKKDYPDLKYDIASIEWRRIWLTKAQSLCNEHNLNGIKGIYRLVLKEDETISYVGQAVNIKERWYQHIKKMVGVEPTGNEKLYNYRPEDFYWTVVEMDCADLNESEHYWIEFFGCKEKGLNRKA